MSPESHDPRLRALLTPEGEEAFHGVVHRHEIERPDPFDVSAIHEQARSRFERMIDRACDAERPPRSGRSLLLLGEAGAGKTHLMRAFRNTVHSAGAGYVAYLQITSESQDYASFLLGQLLHSLNAPYDAARSDESGLRRLSNRIVDRPATIEPRLLEELRVAAPGAHLGRALNKALNKLHRDVAALRDLTTDTLGGLVLMQNEDPRVRSLASNFLRCQPLSKTNCRHIGDLIPMTQEGAAMEVLCDLGLLMRWADGGAMVLLVDQLEQMSAVEETTKTSFVRAMQVVVDIGDRVPTSVCVLSTLRDLWTVMQQRLAQSLRDRLERDPDALALEASRSAPEIVQLVATRLAAVFEEVGAEPLPGQPVAPFDQQELWSLAGNSAREVLVACLRAIRRVREGAASELRLTQASPDPLAGVSGTPPSAAHSGGAAAATPGATPAAAAPRPVAAAAGGPAKPRASIPQWETRWNDHKVAITDTTPESEDAPAIFQAAVARAASERSEVQLDPVARVGETLALTLRFPATQRKARISLSFTNANARGGALMKEVLAVQARATRAGWLLRTGGWTAGAKTKIGLHLAEMIRAGWQKHEVSEADWRTMLAMDSFSALHSSADGFEAWRQSERPLSQLPLFKRLFDERRLAPWLEPDAEAAASRVAATAAQVSRSAAREAAAEASVASASASSPSVGGARPAGAAAARDPQEDSKLLELGRNTGTIPNRHTLAVQDLVRHCGILGSSGSGKTTLAMNLIERVLERGVPVVIVDRKGDLARWASEDSWTAPLEGEPAARRRALRERLAVALYTPGESRGADIAIPVLPKLAPDADLAQREEAAKSATEALAGLLGYKTHGAAAAKSAVLQTVISSVVSDPNLPTSLSTVMQELQEPSAAVLDRLATFDERDFGKVAKDLNTLRIREEAFLREDSPTLQVERLFDREAHGGKLPLTIISAVGLGQGDTLSYWVSRFIEQITTHLRTRPSDSLQGLVFLDEADLYLPAQGMPVSKKPIMNALKRWRSGGIGLLLATQSPGDLDYRCRDNVHTWFAGLIKEERAFSKMSELLEGLPDAKSKLARMPAHEWVHLSEARPRRFRAHYALLRADQMPEMDIITLAKRLQVPASS